MRAAADILRSDLDPKAWKTLRARANARGWELWRTDPDDGPQRYFVGRHNLVRAIADADEVLEFLERAV